MAQLDISYNKTTHSAGTDIDSKPVVAGSSAVKTEPAKVGVDEKKIAAGPKADVASSASFHVGDLSPYTKESDLLEFFGPELIKSCRVCCDAQTGRSLCYGYVNFKEREDAERAIEEKNYLNLKGRPIRIAWVQKNPSYRSTNKGNLFIKNVERVVDARTLYDAFKTFGTVLSFKIATDEIGHSKGYGFIHYAEESVANLVIEKLNDLDYRGKKITVQHFLSKEERPLPASATEYNNLYFKGYLEVMTQDEMLKELSKYGTIVSHYFSSKEKNQQEGYGFAAFETHENAIYAEKQISSTLYKGDKKIYIARALSKRERVQQVEEARRQRRQARYQSNKNLNLFVKNFDISTTTQTLTDLFSPFGTITSAVVMKNSQGQSLGYGFVCFAVPESAEKAMEHFRKPSPDGSSIYVNYYQLKEDREKNVRERFNKINLNDGVPQASMSINAAINAGIPAHQISQLQDSAYQKIHPQMGGYGQFVPPQYIDRTRMMNPMANIHSQPFYGNSNQFFDNRPMGQHQHFDGSRRTHQQQMGGSSHKMISQQNSEMGQNMYSSSGGNNLRIPVNHHQNNRQGGGGGGNMHQMRKNNNYYTNKTGGNHQQFYPRQQNQQAAYSVQPDVPVDNLSKSSPAAAATTGNVIDSQKSAGHVPNNQKSEMLFTKLKHMYADTQSLNSIGMIVSMISNQYSKNLDDFLNDEDKLKQASAAVISILNKQSQNTQ